MKLPTLLLPLCFALCTNLVWGDFGPIPDGDFDSPAGSAGAWASVSGGGVFAFSYPTTGGNPAGYGVIDNTGAGGFGLWVGNGGLPLPLASVGLVAGKTYTFLQDMKILSGTRIGGFKIDFFTGTTANGSTGDMYPASGSAAWATYSFPVTIRAGTDGIKVVPLWGPGSVVAYDNVRIKQNEPLAATIKAGALVSWTASNANTYQPQESSNGVDWTNVGAVIAGAAVQSLVDETPSLFYQVLEVVPGTAANAVPNGGFEETAANSLTATGWTRAVLPNTGATMTVVSAFEAIQPHGGGRFLKLESVTAATGAVAPPNTDVRSLLFEVTPGTAYALSFYAANPVKTGGANPQYSIFYYNTAGGLVGAPVFTSFSNVGAAWTKVSATVTPPAGTAKMTLGWIQAMGGGNGWRWVTLVDDVAMSTGAAGPNVTNILATAGEDAVEVTWNSVAGTSYLFQSSTDLSAWTTIGDPVLGSGSTSRATDPRNGTWKFYRAKAVP